MSFSTVTLDNASGSGGGGGVNTAVKSNANLAAIPTASGAMVLGTVIQFVNSTDGNYAANPTLVSWQLVAGTNATGGQYYRPTDYNASTNAVVWLQVL